MPKAVKLFSATLIGVEAHLVEVECDQRPGMIKTHIVGLPDKACSEAKQRLRSALRNSGVPLPRGQVILNLAPAELPKSGSGFDLPMAVGMSIRSGFIKYAQLDKVLFVGELSLDGDLRPVKGILSIAQRAKQEGFEQIVVPKGNAQEASLIQGLDVFFTDRFEKVIEWLQGRGSLSQQLETSIRSSDQVTLVDFCEVKGHAFAKRALEIAAAGGHNVLMSGPPGSGKTMLAKSLVGILPALSMTELIEVTKIHSAAGQLTESSYITERPFRHPHHSASAVSLVGGGSKPRPGEISLAHHGVLFLDELPEFPRPVLETLRQPLEDGVVTISRAQNTCVFPAQFQLVAAMNPCPCGFVTDPEKDCRCRAFDVVRYQSRLSGPLLDRFDLFLEVPRLEWDELVEAGEQEVSCRVRERVLLARARQKQRSGKINQCLSSKELMDQAYLSKEALAMLKSASKTMGLSNRGYYRVLRVARTIADLACSKEVRHEHVAEAMQYRKVEEV